jgi:hypothetical protein
VYVLGVDALQAQLDHYPWSMNFAETYEEMAVFEMSAGDKGKAEEYKKKAEEYKSRS